MLMMLEERDYKRSIFTYKRTAIFLDRNESVACQHLYSVIQNHAILYFLLVSLIDS